MSIAEIGKVGVIGLGAMGAALARHLKSGGFEVTGFDVRADAMRAVAADGGAAAASPGDVAAASDLVIVGVGFDSEVETVVFGENGLLSGARAGCVIAIASTVAPTGYSSPSTPDA